MVLGGHLIKSWSSTQTSVSLSSGESEFYGVVKAGGVSLGYQALLRDLGLNLPVRVWTDSTATLGICGRQGLGKLRHIDTQCLWIQQRVRDKSIELYKAKGEDNPADLFTKHLASRDRIHRLLELFNCRYAHGRAEAAPQMRKELGTSKGENLCQLETPRGWRDPRLCGEAIEEFCGNVAPWDGGMFPTTTLDGVCLPEAFPSGREMAAKRRLPHQLEDWKRRFPRAVACEGPGDEDFESQDALTTRGQQIG